MLLLEKLEILGADPQPQVFFDLDELTHAVGTDSADRAPFLLLLTPLLLVELFQKREDLLSSFLRLVDSLEKLSLC